MKKLLLVRLKMEQRIYHRLFIAILCTYLIKAYFQEAFVKIFVNFKPLVKIKQIVASESSGDMLKEGEKLKLYCDANGNPSNFQFNWLLDGQKVNGKFNIQTVF